MNMNIKKKIPIGSAVFFSTYADYKSHDQDFLCIVENPTIFKDFMNIRGKGQDLFLFRDMSKDEFIEYSLKHCAKTPMAAGKFLVPAVLEYFNMTLEDLQLFESAFLQIDKRHKYEEVIYNSYIKNGNTTLTIQQMQDAYNLYKENKV